MFPYKVLHINVTMILIETDNLLIIYDKFSIVVTAVAHTFVHV